MKINKKQINKIKNIFKNKKVGKILTKDVTVKSVFIVSND